VSSSSTVVSLVVTVRLFADIFHQTRYLKQWTFGRLPEKTIAHQSWLREIEVNYEDLTTAGTGWTEQTQTLGADRGRSNSANCADYKNTWKDVSIHTCSSYSRSMLLEKCAMNATAITSRRIANTQWIHRNGELYITSQPVSEWAVFYVPANTV